MNEEIAAMAVDINNGHIIDLHNAREVAAISQHMQNQQSYDARFEDKLTVVLKHSMQTGVYRRTSLPTPPPASIVRALQNRV